MGMCVLFYLALHVYELGYAIVLECGYAIVLECGFAIVLERSCIGVDCTCLGWQGVYSV